MVTGSSCSASLSTRSRAARVVKPFDDIRRAVMALRPAVGLQGFRETLFLDINQFVERPPRPLVFLDRERAERDVLVAMGMIDRAARLAVHAGNLAILGFIVSNNPLEVADQQFLVGFFQHDRAELVENLALVEAIFAVATRCRD